MVFSEYFRMAWEAIRASKLRSFLTLLGIIIGVFSIIASVTAVKVIEVSFAENINVLGSTSFSVWRYPAVNFGDSRSQYRNRPNITYDEAQQLIRRARTPLAISPWDDFDHTKIVGGGNETRPNVTLYGADQNYIVNQNYEIGEGRFLIEGDVQFGRSVAVLGATVASTLFPNTNPVGQDIRVRGRRYQVIGVLASKGQVFGEDQDRLVIIPITTAFAAYGQAQRNIFIDVRAPSVETLNATIDEVTGHMRAIRRVAPGEENNFEVITNESLVKTFTQFTPYLTMGGAAIGLVALLAAGIGIMNIMLVSVTERTREIGIRKSLGATRRDVLSQFLLEAVFLCQLGGIFGILLGVAGGNALSLMFQSSPTFPWEWAIGGVVGVTIIALIFGVYPAWKAAKLNPIEALRYE